MGNSCSERGAIVESLAFARNAITLRTRHSLKKVTLILGDAYNDVLLANQFDPVNEHDVSAALGESVRTTTAR